MHLPPELQNLVCRELNKSELKLVRLVCKSLDQAAVPFLFNEVFVAATNSDLDIADLVASRFGPYIRTITLSFVEYDHLSIEQFREKTELRTRGLQRINGHLEHAFKVYHRLRTENLEINESGELLAKTCFVLSKSPNARKMVLTDCGNDDLFDTDPLRLHDPWKKDDLCPFKACKLGLSHHLSFHVRPRSPYQGTSKAFHQAMLAISVAKSTITELEMIHDGEAGMDMDFALTQNAFTMLARQSRYLTIQLQHLIKLRMRLHYDGGQKADRVVAKALSPAVNLESLFLESYIYDPRPEASTAIFGFLSGCHFPKLRSLILDSMNSTEDELLDFLKTSPGLKHLTLEHFFLIIGSWEVVAERIRSVLRLKSVMIQDFVDGMPNFGHGKYYQGLYSYSNDHRVIEDFFLRNGKNPFTKEAMETWYEKDIWTRERINEVQTSEKRYQMFH